MHPLRGLAVALALAVPALAQDDAAARVRAVLARDDCQTSLPGEPPRIGADEVGRKPERTGGTKRRERRTDEGIRNTFSLPNWFGTFLLWVGVAVVVAVLVAALVEAVRDRAPVEIAKPKARVRGVGPASPPPPGLPTDLPDPERLAEAGAFADAVHALLLLAIRRWQDRGEFVPAHATAREVLRAVRRKGSGVPAFAALVGAVELAVFGGRAVDREAYERSRASLADWELACAPKAAERRS